MEHDRSHSAVTAQASTPKTRKNYTTGCSESVVWIISVNTNESYMARLQRCLCKPPLLRPPSQIHQLSPILVDRDITFPYPPREKLTPWSVISPSFLYCLDNCCFLCDHHKISLTVVRFLETIYSICPQMWCLSGVGVGETLWSVGFFAAFAFYCYFPLCNTWEKNPNL